MRATDGPRFCSDASRLRGDENAATAARIASWILIELPQPWGSNPIHDAVLPQSVRENLLRASRAIPRVRILFIRRRHETSETSRIYVARSGAGAGVAMRALPGIEDVAEVNFEALLEQVTPPEKPLVLVCTHGQHDSCCGRRGFRLYDAMRNREDLDVWQCSHIGGDRFAANALVLPWGLFYGPVEPHESDAFADAVVDDSIYVSAYRGDSSMTRPLQAAEIFIRRAHPLRARTALRFSSRENIGDGRVRVVFRDDADVTSYEAVVESYVAGEGLLTCSSSARAPIPQYRLVEQTVRR